MHRQCAWWGNSLQRLSRCAEGYAKHDLKVRDSHFQKAASACVFSRVQNMTATCSKPSQADEAAYEKTLENDDSPAFPLCDKYTREDSKESGNGGETPALIKTVRQAVQMSSVGR